MGQYYTPVIKRNNRFNNYYSHNYGNGLKLMEHSYIRNNFVDTVLKELYKNPGKLAWVGDYAEPDDVNSPEALDFIKSQERDIYTNPKRSDGSFMVDKVVVNHTKKEYVNLAEYIESATKDDWDFQINPIPLLTAIGNGKGGGDYCGNQENMIGHWACDELEVVDEIPDGYTNIVNDVYFEEH